jgi:hypothetical protein
MASLQPLPLDSPLLLQRMRDHAVQLFPGSYGGQASDLTIDVRSPPSVPTAQDPSTLLPHVRLLIPSSGAYPRWVLSEQWVELSAVLEAHESWPILEV